MLHTRLFFAFAAAAGLASAQMDSPGVTVDLNGAMLLHRTSVAYPETVRSKNVKGSVTVEVTLDATGNVSDARVLSGPEELRKGALQSVLNWHFAHEAPGSRRQVTIVFDPAATRPAVPIARAQAPAQDLDRVQRQMVEEKIKALEVEATEARRQQRDFDAARTQAVVAEMRKQAEAARLPRNIQSIQILGLSDQLRAELLAKLPLREGDVLTAEALEKAGKAVREFDEHMTISQVSSANGMTTLQIGSPESRMMAARMETSTTAMTPQRIKVGGNVQQSKLVKQARPAYPAEAKQARLQGVVQLSAIIGRDGTVQQLEVISGHPLLVPSALEAVRQWVYQPTLLNGNPVEVVTQIDVNYTLSQ